MTFAGDSGLKNERALSVDAAYVIELYQQGLAGEESPGLQVLAIGSWNSLWISACHRLPSR